jgi:hypothetical protein
MYVDGYPRHKVYVNGPTKAVGINLGFVYADGFFKGARHRYMYDRRRLSHSAGHGSRLLL